VPGKVGPLLWPSTRTLAKRVDARCQLAGVHLYLRSIEAVFAAVAAELRTSAGAAFAQEEEATGAVLQAVAGWLEDAAR
jgi:hypothetical protein